MRLALLRLLFVLPLALLGGCPPAKEAETPVIVNDPIDVGRACEDAQENLVRMECDWQVNAKNQTWASRCHALAKDGYPRMGIVAECVHLSQSCKAAEGCR